MNEHLCFTSLYTPASYLCEDGVRRLMSYIFRKFLNHRYMGGHQSVEVLTREHLQGKKPLKALTHKNTLTIYLKVFLSSRIPSGVGKLLVFWAAGL